MQAPAQQLQQQPEQPLPWQKSVTKIFAGLFLYFPFSVDSTTDRYSLQFQFETDKEEMAKFIAETLNFNFIKLNITVELKKVSSQGNDFLQMDISASTPEILVSENVFNAIKTQLLYGFPQNIEREGHFYTSLYTKFLQLVNPKLVLRTDRRELPTVDVYGSQLAMAQRYLELLRSICMAHNQNSCLEIIITPSNAGNLCHLKIDLTKLEDLLFNISELDVKIGNINQQVQSQFLLLEQVSMNEGKTADPDTKKTDDSSKPDQSSTVKRVIFFPEPVVDQPTQKQPVLIKPVKKSSSCTIA